MADGQIRIRKFKPEDKPAIAEILEQTNVFTEEEIGIAVELMDEVIASPMQRDYDIYTAVGDDSQIVGYYCVGPTPLTRGTYDLYWIAVKPSSHQKGIGGLLIRHCEELVKSLGGRIVIAETSSMPHYDATRRFYRHQGYLEVGKIKDYYKLGDDLIIYAKYVQQ
ncbi:MAG: GNAT family N-acetyltransferase [Bacteroidetes bacterium]|nr:MAG: GNAT family N-acetyltransferase [Bacteroidota bacterium]